MYRNFQNVATNFWRADSGRIQIFQSSLKVVWPQQKLWSAMDIIKWPEQLRVWIKWRNLFSETEEAVNNMGISCGGQVRAFWKTVWACIGLQSNSCSPSAHCASSVPEFLARTEQLLFHTLPTPLTWWCDFSLFPKLFVSNSTLNGGTFAGHGVRSLKETTLKGTTFIRR